MKRNHCIDEIQRISKVIFNRALGPSLCEPKTCISNNCIGTQLLMSSNYWHFTDHLFCFLSFFFFRCLVSCRSFYSWWTQFFPLERSQTKLSEQCFYVSWGKRSLSADNCLCKVLYTDMKIKLSGCTLQYWRASVSGQCRTIVTRAGRLRLLKWRCFFIVVVVVSNFLIGSRPWLSRCLLVVITCEQSTVGRWRDAQLGFKNCLFERSYHLQMHTPTAVDPH